jgi:hypothetical protein
MFQGPSTRKAFVVACKKCRRDVPTGVAEFPFQSIIVECALCGEKCRYLPSEVFLGRADQLVARQKRARELMFDPDANMPRINREKAYLTSEIGGRSMNSRLAGTNLISMNCVARRTS